MGACGAGGEEPVACTSEKDRLLTDAANEHAAVRERAHGNATSQIRPHRRHVVFTHVPLLVRVPSHDVSSLMIVECTVPVRRDVVASTDVGEHGTGDSLSASGRHANYTSAPDAGSKRASFSERRQH